MLSDAMVKYSILAFVVLALIFAVTAITHAAERAITIPKGLSDTAFDRAFDNALEDAEPNQLINWTDGYDTPTPGQTFHYMMHFSTFSDTDIYDTDAAFDTRVLERTDVPVDLAIIEEYDTATLELIGYNKKVYSDSTW